MITSTIKKGNQMDTITDKIRYIINQTEEAAKDADSLYMEMVEVESVNDLDARRFELIEEGWTKLEDAIKILYEAHGTSQRFDKSQQQATA